jgi:hypothetical protein
MPLRPVTITNQLAWLPRNTGAAAAALQELPARYEAYLKLLPPLGIDRDVPIADYSFARRTVAELNARAAFWNTYGIVQGQPMASHLQQISYQQVAATLGLPYNADFDAATIRRAYGGHWPPHLGISPLFMEAFAHRLAQILGPATAVYFFGSQEEGGTRWDSEGFPIDWLEMGTLADLQEVYRRDGAFPTYVFATDRSWCLYQTELTEWLALGCTTELAAALLAQADVETFRLPA